uniref:Nuclear pore complex protein Nup205 n=1 Tax=Ciona savignyi TaxID=51511 RepID=H2Z552_CIOSA
TSFHYEVNDRMDLNNWSPYKDLFAATQEFALRNSQASTQQLRSLLRRNKPEFLSLLKNTPKNAEQREKVKNGHTVGLVINENDPPKILEKSFIEEALIISDIFDLNELAAVDLLLTGEQQTPNYPSYSRGLVAVLLYWDGRRNLVSSLRTLVQSRRGTTWTLDISPEGASMVTAFTDDLLRNGMTQQILGLLSKIKVEAEIEKLAIQRGLGDAKHRKQVRDLIAEVRQSLAETLFYFAGQSRLPLMDVSSMIHYLEANSEVESDGKLTPSTLAVLFAVLYAISLPCDLSAVQENNVDELLQHPLVTDPSYLSGIHKLLVKESTWKVVGVRSCMQLAWSVTLRLLAQIPTSLLSGTTPPSGEILEQDEMVVEMSMTDRVFHFIKENIVGCPGFHSEEFYLRRIHGIITDLIVNMTLKVKEMRNHGDEVARILMLHMSQNEEPPASLRKDFQQLLELITALYGDDPLTLELSSEYWCTADNPMMADAGSFIVPSHRFHHGPPQKQASLFKFIRQSGDLLPPLLYVPYLNMLAALASGPQSARVCYELLHYNGSNFSNSDVNSMSFDHFFTSCHRYYAHLHHDRPLHDSTHSPRNRTITPKEVEGLRAVMNLLTKVIKYDDIACINIYENQQWSACGVLCGLLQCPVPVKLKGDIIAVLTQLARIPEIASGLMQITESAQILVTSGDNTQGGGVSLELEQIESREESYPMTMSFVNLLTAMANSGANLAVIGEGVRSPGFDPYLTFVVESVFLKFPTRVYAKLEEKWEVASCCLKLFNKLITTYQPHPDHFKSHKINFSFDNSRTGSQISRDFGSNPVKAIHPPAFPLMLYVYNEGNFFKTVSLWTNAIKYLDSYASKPTQERSLVEAATLVMQILLNSLLTQDLFMSCMRESGSAILLTSLDKLLLGLNQKSGKADYVVTLARFVIHHVSHPHLSLLAIRIISHLCSSAATQREVVTAITKSCSVATQLKILHGFVEVLDTSAPEFDRENQPQDLTDASYLMGQCRQDVLRLLVHCVDMPHPNVSTFLLGFDLSKPPNRTSLQGNDPGILGSNRSCLHSVLTILSLEGSVDTQEGVSVTQPLSVIETPKLSELSYQLVHKLAANVDTSAPVLRYLRSSFDFIYKQLQYLPFSNPDPNKSKEVLMQQAWLLKTVAIELYSLALKRQRANAERTLKVVRTLAGDTSLTQHSMSLLDASTSVATSSQRKELAKMLQTFDVLDLAQEFPRPLTLEQFVPSVVEEAIRSCESSNEHGIIYCDVKMLHNILEASCSTLSAAEDANRKHLALLDMQNILQNAIDRNQTRETVHAKLSFLTGWRHTLEIALTACPVDLLSKEMRQQVLISTLQHLVNTARSSDATPELTAPIAGIALMIIVQIRATFLDAPATKYDWFLDLLHYASFNFSRYAVVIRGLMEWLLQAGLPQKVRTHLYASLLYYLQVCQKPKETNQKSKSRRTVGMLLSSDNDIYSRLSRDNLQLIQEYGDAFMDLVCKDVCSGHSVCRVLAFACLDAIQQIDTPKTWLQYMVKNGYMAHIAHSFSQEDQSLLASLNPNQETPRSVFIYEQKMSLLCSIAETQGGARAIIDSGILTQLSECNFLEMRPSHDDNEYSCLPLFFLLFPDTTTIGSSAASRYQQLLFPALRLCSALLATLGQSHHESSALVLQFLLSHINPVVNSVLKVQSI